MRRPHTSHAPTKYKAKPTIVDGVRFASQKEARRYSELKLLEKAGEIEQLILQPEYKLRSFASGELIGTYRGDFQYYDRKTSRDVLEDVKGFKTPLYRWKKKHVEAQYGITITEI